MLQFATDRYNATQQAFPDPQAAVRMLAYLTIFFFCAASPGNGSPTYPAFEVYNIKKK